MTFIPSESFILKVAKGEIPNHSIYNKYGASPDVDTGDPAFDIWNVDGDYTGFNTTTGQAISLSCSGGGSANNTGGVLSVGTVTTDANDKLIDSGADFVADGVSAGDLVMNDTLGVHGIITAVAPTSLLIYKMVNGESNLIGNSYRIATSTGTGAAVVRITKALESDYNGYKTEYVVLNGNTVVNTVGTDYIRDSRGQVVLAGSNGGVQGNINANQSVTTTNVFWRINEDHNQSLTACDTIPKGFTLYVYNIECTMARVNGSLGSAEVEFQIRDIGEVFTSKIHQYISNSQGYETKLIGVINEYADFKWRVLDVSDNNTQIAGLISGILVKNN